MRLSKENYLKLVTALHGLFVYRGGKLIFTFWGKSLNELEQLFSGIHNQCQNLQPNLNTLLLLIELLCEYEPRGPTAQYIQRLKIIFQPEIGDEVHANDEAEAEEVARRNQVTQAILEDSPHTDPCEAFVTYMSSMG